MNTKPKRRFHLTMTVQGDTREALIELLSEFYHAIKDRNEPGRLIVGRRRGSGGFYTLAEDSQMTPERYRRELQAHLAAAKDGAR